MSAWGHSTWAWLRGPGRGSDRSLGGHLGSLTPQRREAAVPPLTTSALSVFSSWASGELTQALSEVPISAPVQRKPCGHRVIRQRLQPRRTDPGGTGLLPYAAGLRPHLYQIAAVVTEVMGRAEDVPGGTSAAHSMAFFHISRGWPRMGTGVVFEKAGSGGRDASLLGDSRAGCPLGCPLASLCLCFIICKRMTLI